MWHGLGLLVASVLAFQGGGGEGMEGQRRVALTPAMLKSSSDRADFKPLIDEQPEGEPGGSNPARGWVVQPQDWKGFPYSVRIELGGSRHLSSLWLYDTFDKGQVRVKAGGPDQLAEVAELSTDSYMVWKHVPLDVTASVVELTLESPAANFAELVLYEYTPEAYAAQQERKAAEAKEAAKREARKAAAREELARQPVVELPIFGKARLVDEVDLAAVEPGHGYREFPEHSGRVETVLGKACRVMAAVGDQASFLAVRLGQDRLLKSGAAYVLVVEYPEDQPRSLFVRNGGNETSLGFHTGTTVGDALHAKYVSGQCESLRLPLSGAYETWTLGFNLHNRFPDIEWPRGPGGRTLRAEDGFPVVLGQYKKRDDPTSAGIAARSIRLYEVIDPKAQALAIAYPPAPLPRRHVFWREEMADGVIDSDKPEERGLDERLDWYRFKADQMALLGINTFTKDLLEFGACQHWDPSPYGGNSWVHFAGGSKDLWGQVVGLMGERGYGVLPYYEYSGSKGDNGLGYQKRCKPLTRDDAFTHISWIESANADVTDPDTLADFGKMLDVTVLRMKDKARFEGVWLRPRSQWPMSFGEGALRRFGEETQGGKVVTRAQLRGDAKLLRQYEGWWYGKRREFLAGVRDILRKSGLPDADVLFTAHAGEPIPGFPTWERRMVTDDVSAWTRILKEADQLDDGKGMVPVGIDRVVSDHLYLDALKAPGLNWGGWEIDHAGPPADPAHYKDVEGVLLTHAIGRAYTSVDPASFEAFRGPSGLAAVHHYPLNEHMVADASDKPTLGYFVADDEPAGAFCMLSEVLAVANGDPTWLGSLRGGNMGRGFPQYVRDFHANYLALPALPSERLAGVANDEEVVVRAIRTAANGTYLAVVNTGLSSKPAVTIKLPKAGRVTEATTGRELEIKGGAVTLPMGAAQLRSLHIE